MNLTSERTIKYKPVYLILIVLAIIFMAAGLLQKNYYKDVFDNMKNALEEDINFLEKRIDADSIERIEIDKRILLSEEIIDSLTKEKDYFKNKAYANYKKYVDEASANYNSGTDDDKNNTFTDLINEQ